MIDIKAADYNNECFIVGGGTSLKNFDWSLLDVKFVIAINRAYEKLPNAQIIYFTDEEWYDDHKDNLRSHAGQKIKGSLHPDRFNDNTVIQYYLSTDAGLVTEPGELAHGRNSTHAAINLAGIHWGFKKIYLLGIDMRWGTKGDKATSHWHDGHSRVDHESVYTMMISYFDKIKEPLKDNGIEVINVNDPEWTHLKSFPIQTVEQVFKIR